MLLAIAGCLCLGLGLVAFWAVQLFSHSALDWLMWLTGGLGLLSMAGTLLMPAFRALRGWVPLFCAIVLLFAWAASIAIGTGAWQCWWTFWFGAAYSVLGIRAFGPAHDESGSESIGKSESEKEQAKEARRSA